MQARNTKQPDYTSLVPRPRPAFCHLQYRKAVVHLRGEPENEAMITQYRTGNVPEAPELGTPLTQQGTETLIPDDVHYRGVPSYIMYCT